MTYDTEGQTIDDVRAERDALGIQLAAAQERLRLAMACVKKADIVEGWHEGAGMSDDIDDE